MAQQNYELEFDGYWREKNKNGIPNASGIYCVYTCVFNETEKNLSIQKLLYIGESENVRERLSNHEKQSLWEKYLNKGEVLCYSVSKVSSKYRNRCEAALINKHTPPENIEYANAFQFDKTKISLSGNTTELITSFTIDRH